MEEGLRRLDFEPDPSEDGWRWLGPTNGMPVKLEFLCDLPNHREKEIIRPNGCQALSAANLRGTGYVARDFVWQELSGELADGTTVAVRVRFASLESYLLSKCVAVRTRAATKDYYDLVYVLQHNRAGGPEQAAGLLLSGGFVEDLKRLQTTFVEVRERYVKTTDSGPIGYAEQALEAQPEADAAELRADAVDVVQRFFIELGFMRKARRSAPVSGSVPGSFVLTP